MTTTYATAYARTHTAAFVADEMGSLLRLLVQYHGLDPTALMDALSRWAGSAARQWLEPGDLRSIVIEFYKSGTNVALARWDFPIRYDGNWVDDMWVDRAFLQGSFAKSTAPPPSCIYRILLTVAPWAADISGVGNANFST